MNEPDVTPPAFATPDPALALMTNTLEALIVDHKRVVADLDHALKVLSTIPALLTLLKSRVPRLTEEEENVLAKTIDQIRSFAMNREVPPAGKALEGETPTK